MAIVPPLLPSLLAVIVFSAPEQIIPVNPGTTWHYDMVEEAGPGARLADASNNEAGTLRDRVLYRIHGTREMDGRKLLEFEMHRAGRITTTDLITVDEKGVQCWARIDDTGRLTKLDPPLPIVAAPVTVGTAWDFDGEPDGAKTHQHYEIVGQAEITIPAGTYRAFHIRGEQTLPGPMTIDRWFVPGLGIVKDVTETRSDSGELLRRITLEMAGQPKVAGRPEIKPQSETNKLTVSLGQEALGESRTDFVTVTPKIYARWQGKNLRDQAKIRVLWIAEQVEGVAPPDYTIDEAATMATSRDSHGIFILARPEDGWAPGIYRVEFYVDGLFTEAVKAKVAESEATKF
ncbi:MAG TPA: hypothetical protein VJ719_12685 [Chthoniobacterales bacterium]|nr:hypothetical protein [Chthoniobacterales bacterium]